jgi:hypothetical protein
MKKRVPILSIYPMFISALLECCEYERALG